MEDLKDERSANLLREAYKEALNSIDPSTQNGAVLALDQDYMDKPEIIGRGFNRFAIGVATTPERLADRDEKYPRTAHAEELAILQAFKGGLCNYVHMATLYVAWYACEHCATIIIESGVRRVVGHREHPGVLNLHSKWAKSVKMGLSMLHEAGVECLYYTDEGKGLGCQPLRLDYKYWTP